MGQANRRRPIAITRAQITSDRRARCARKTFGFLLPCTSTMAIPHMTLREDSSLCHPANQLRGRY